MTTAKSNGNRSPICCALSMFAAVRPPTAILIVRLTSGWARIYLDGEFRGERPVHREELPPGTHTLRLERPGFVPADTTFTLRAGQNLIEIEMRRVTP